MNICTANGLAHEFEAGPQTWGQRLIAMARGDGPERTVVAAVRFAGVDQPTFREPETLALAIHEISPIDVELSTANDLVTGAREAILGGLGGMAESARQAAESFRLHDLSRAHRGLAEFVGTFQLLTSLTAALDRTDAPSDLPGPDASGAECLARLNASLGSLIDFDMNEDWLSVADALEYDIADLIPQWAAAVRDCDGSNAGSAA